MRAKNPYTTGSSLARGRREESQPNTGTRAIIAANVTVKPVLPAPVTEAVPVVPRIALIADIHGNAVALQTAFEEIVRLTARVIYALAYLETGNRRGHTFAPIDTALGLLGVSAPDRM